MFTKKVNYGKSFHLGFHEAEKTFERPRAALSVAKSRSEEEAKRLQSVGDDDVFEGENTLGSKTRVLGKSPEK